MRAYEFGPEKRVLFVAGFGKNVPGKVTQRLLPSDGLGHLKRTEAVLAELNSFPGVKGHLVLLNRSGRTEEELESSEYHIFDNARSLALYARKFQLIVVDVTNLNLTQFMMLRKSGPLINLAPRGLQRALADYSITSTTIGGGLRRFLRRPVELTGPFFWPVRQEFSLPIKKCSERDPSNRIILLALGGKDAAGLTIRCLDWLLGHSGLGGLKIRVVKPTSVSLTALIAEKIKTSNIAVEFFEAPQNMPERIQEADLVVTGVGNLMEESLFLGRQTVVVPLTFFHWRRARELQRKGLIDGVAVSRGSMARVLGRLLPNGGYERRPGVDNPRLPDGLGAWRIAHFIHTLAVKNHHGAS